MIVKILSSAASFSGVRYNTNKVDSGKGELMLVKNFGTLQGLSGLRPDDYRNYLKIISATNKAVKNPQFHAAISAEGRTYDKHGLTEIAVQWLAKMGYADQPYLVVFHRDTANNHIHIVTARIDRQGRKINSGFENIRAVQNLNTIIGVDEKRSANTDIEKALRYNFSTRAQFMMMLEAQGYKVREKIDNLYLIKFGKVQGSVSLSQIHERLLVSACDEHRKKQIAALLHKYAPQYERPELIEYLKQKHGISLLFHAKEGKKPYGYSIIDHPGKAVYKGGDILSLAALHELTETGQVNAKGKSKAAFKEAVAEPSRRNYYKAILHAAMNNYPDIRQGLRHADIGIYLRDDRFYLLDHSCQAYIPLAQLLNETEYGAAMRAFVQSGELQDEITQQHIPIPATASDIDDEAVYGRNRRKRNSRKNGK